jgi:23S rRNA (pseudouridine1915-N3)-methyltransferase
MSMKILAIGKKHEPWVVEGIERYQKRLQPPFVAEWVLLPHSSLEGPAARQEESERLLIKLKQDDFVILLDERGRELDSPGVTALLNAQLTHSRPVTFIIGGAYGVTDTLRQRADVIWSLSPLVFPHQLVRLILVEQLYRAQEISRGGHYHHR